MGAINKGIVYSGGYVDINGDPVQRTVMSHPYSYDAFVKYRGGQNEEITHSVYSDRLLGEFSQEVLKAAKLKHFKSDGDFYDKRDPKDVERFLSELYGKPVKLIVIIQDCNVSNGFPLWAFLFSMPS